MSRKERHARHVKEFELAEERRMIKRQNHLFRLEQQQPKSISKKEAKKLRWLEKIAKYNMLSSVASVNSCVTSTIDIRTQQSIVVSDAERYLCTSLRDESMPDLFQENSIQPIILKNEAEQNFHPATLPFDYIAMLAKNLDASIYSFAKNQFGQQKYLMQGVVQYWHERYPKFIRSDGNTKADLNSFVEGYAWLEGENARIIEERRIYLEARPEMRESLSKDNESIYDLEKRLSDDISL